jgi:type III pantothenate kinase
MLLAMDIGNTNVVLGLFDDGGAARATVRVATRRETTADEISMAVHHLAMRAGTSPESVSRTVVCSVVPSLEHAVTAFTERELGHAPFLVSAREDLGVPIAVDDPREVGPDRIVNALAAREECGTPAIVVDLGTATTFDCLDGDGRYVGGVIAPGVETSAEELFRRAARLTKVDFTFPERVLGSNTRDCLRSGAMYGTVGMIDALVEGLWKDLGARGAAVATGGLAPSIGPACRTIDRVDVDLTLKGLQAVDRRIRGRSGPGPG